MPFKIFSNNLFSLKNRLWLTVSLTFAVAAIITARLFFLQIIKYPAYRDLAAKQQGTNRILEPERGDIYFKDKNGELFKMATTKTGALLFLNNKLLENHDDTFNKLNAITPIDRGVFDKITKKQNDPYEILKHRLSGEEADKIAALALPGVGLAEERWRYYPAGPLGSHLIGFISSASSERAGQYGIEKYYDRALSERLNAESAAGRDLILTVDPALQRTAESELSKLTSKWKAESGGILILNPKTGAILALAGFPNFDPNEYWREENLGVFLNPFVEKIFELGSVFKPLTMAAAIDQGAISPDTVYIDKGEVKINGRVIKNFDGKAHGERTMTQVLEESLNTGAVFAMERLGGEKLREYFHRFGLGEKLGVDLPGELKGDLSNLDTGRKIEFATASFGQGVAVTPLELAMALSALSNGGHLMRPRVAEEILPQTIRDVIKPETSETITKMLVDVVDMSLAGGKAKMPRYSIAAKTGTAQIANPGGKGYSDQVLHSFFGYFPAYDPKFLILIFIERPQGIKYASQSITDTFRFMVEFLINYYIIPPDR